MLGVLAESVVRRLARQVFSNALLQLVAACTRLPLVVVAARATFMVLRVRLLTKLSTNDVAIVVRIDFAVLIRKGHSVRLGLKSLVAIILFALFSLISALIRFECKALLFRGDAA